MKKFLTSFVCMLFVFLSMFTVSACFGGEESPCFVYFPTEEIEGIKSYNCDSLYTTNDNVNHYGTLKGGHFNIQFEMELGYEIGTLKVFSNGIELTNRKISQYDSLNPIIFSYEFKNVQEDQIITITGESERLEYSCDFNWDNNTNQLDELGKAKIFSILTDLRFQYQYIFDGEPQEMSNVYTGHEFKAAIMNEEDPQNGIFNKTNLHFGDTLKIYVKSANRYQYILNNSIIYFKYPTNYTGHYMEVNQTFDKNTYFQVFSMEIKGNANIEFFENNLVYADTPELSLLTKETSLSITDDYGLYDGTTLIDNFLKIKTASNLRFLIEITNPILEKYIKNENLKWTINGFELDNSTMTISTIGTKKYLVIPEIEFPYEYNVKTPKNYDLEVEGLYELLNNDEGLENLIYSDLFKVYYDDAPELDVNATTYSAKGTFLYYYDITNPITIEFAKFYKPMEEPVPPALPTENPTEITEFTITINDTITITRPSDMASGEEGKIEQDGITLIKDNEYEDGVGYKLIFEGNFGKIDSIKIHCNIHN